MFKVANFKVRTHASTHTSFPFRHNTTNQPTNAPFPDLPYLPHTATQHSMLEAVRGKLQRFLAILQEKVAEGDDSAAASAASAPAAVPPSKKEEKGGEEEEAVNGNGRGKGKKQRPSAVVEMQELFFKLTLDTIGEIAFGRDLGSLRCVEGEV